MKRRLALQRVALLVGGAISAPSLAAILNSCKSPSDASTSGFTFSTDQKSLVAEIAEVIIPKTDTPGAKDVNVQDVIEILLKDCYPEAQQKSFAKGLETLEAEAKKLGDSFVKLNDADKMKVLETMRELAKAEKEEAEQKAKQVDSETGQEKQDHKKEVPTIPFFTIVRDLTIFGYYTSEHGITKEYQYLPIPGEYKACITVSPDQIAYS